MCLNCSQSKYNLSLCRFGFVVLYHQGSLQGKLDAFFQPAYLAPKRGHAIHDQQKSVF